MAKQRFIKSVIAASQAETVVLPWARKRHGQPVLSAPLPAMKVA